ncbi:hypothetical protein BDV96DRAFT_144974 [Lophiotrema nucula]|uniref:Fucose-specific lectin n=1 Tax=Lophiotrema nucula TaxID=690887 RepID=A0A6A5Z1V4_9PLEO|nr:hypothetical protein BDV96DRAFT_144974 [Lophiotrema nucula]
MKLDHIVEEEIAPVHEELTALPKWNSVYNPHRPVHTRHGSEDPVLVKDIFSKETIHALGRGDRSVASSLAEEEDNPRHSRMMVWLVLCLVTLLVLAIVLGAVLGTFLNPGRSPSPIPSVTEIPAGQTPTPTAGSGQQAPTSAPSLHITSLAATGWSIEGPQGYFTTWLFWQNSKGYLSRATFNSSTGNWTRVTNFAEAQAGTPMAAASFSTEYYKSQPHYNLVDNQHQSMVIYRDSTDRIIEWVFQENGSVTGQPGSLNEQKYMSHAASKVAAYWPRILYQGMSGEVREARFECYEDNECWNDDVLSTTQPVNGTQLTTIPMQNNHSSYALFYQEEDGRYLTYLEGANESSTLYANQAFSERIPINASVAAFSTTREGDDSSLNAYLLWQDEGGIIQMSWADDYTGWKGPISHAAFAGAEDGTALTCVTGLTFSGFLLPEGSELARCYFQTGAAVREVSFDGTSWDVVGVVPIEL